MKRRLKNLVKYFQNFRKEKKWSETKFSVKGDVHGTPDEYVYGQGDVHTPDGLNAS